MTTALTLLLHMLRMWLTLTFSYATIVAAAYLAVLELS